MTQFENVQPCWSMCVARAKLVVGHIQGEVAMNYMPRAQANKV